MHGRIRGLVFLAALAAMALPQAALSHESWGAGSDRSAPATTDSSASRSSPAPSYSPPPTSSSDRSWSASGSSDSSSGSGKSGGTQSNTDTSSRSQGPFSSDRSDGRNEPASDSISATEGPRGDDNRAQLTDPGLRDLPHPANFAALMPPTSIMERPALPAPPSIQELISTPITERLKPLRALAVNPFLVNPMLAQSSFSAKESGWGHTQHVVAAPYEPSPTYGSLAASLNLGTSALSGKVDSLGVSTALLPASWVSPAPALAYNARGGMFPGATLFNFAPLIVLPAGSFPTPEQQDVEIISTDDTNTDKQDARNSAPSRSTGQPEARKAGWTIAAPPSVDGDGQGDNPNRHKKPEQEVLVRPTWGHPVTGTGKPGGVKLIPGPPGRPRTAAKLVLPAVIRYSKFVLLTFARGEREASALLIPPPGERLVLMYSSLVNGLPRGQSVHVSYSTYVPMGNLQGSFHPMTLDPGSTLTVYGERNSTEGRGCVWVYFYGYLTAVPHDSDLP